MDANTLWCPLTWIEKVTCASNLSSPVLILWLVPVALLQAEIGSHHTKADKTTIILFSEEKCYHK
jgi:hypothetical protein